MIEIKKSKNENIRDIATCHRQAFGDSLSSKLGLKHCMKMMSFYIEDERGILYHASDNGKIIGYCGGLMNTKPGQPGSATSMIQFSFKSIILSILVRPWLLFQKEIRHNISLIAKNIKLKLFKNLVKARHVPDNVVSEFVPSIGLVVIGVLPEQQGKGYGSLLLNEFEHFAQKEGFKKMVLSVKKDNHKAIRAYERNGWTIQHSGREEHVMTKTI